MRNTSSVLGVVAPRVRPTVSGAFWLALLVALPVGVIGFALDTLVR